MKRSINRFDDVCVGVDFLYDTETERSAVYSILKNYKMFNMLFKRHVQGVINYGFLQLFGDGQIISKKVYHAKVYILF